MGTFRIEAKKKDLCEKGGDHDEIEMRGSMTGVILILDAKKRLQNGRTKCYFNLLDNHYRCSYKYGQFAITGIALYYVLYLILFVRIFFQFY